MVTFDIAVRSRRCPVQWTFVFLAFPLWFGHTWNAEHVDQPPNADTTQCDRHQEAALGATEIVAMSSNKTEREPDEDMPLWWTSASDVRSVDGVM